MEAELPEVKVCGEAGEDEGKEPETGGPDEGKEPEFPFYAPLLRSLTLTRLKGGELVMVTDNFNN